MPVTAILAQYIRDWNRLSYELLHGKTNETIYVPSEDSDQNEHPYSPIRVIPVISMGSKDQSFLYDSGQTALHYDNAGCRATIIAFVKQWWIYLGLSRHLTYCKKYVFFYTFAAILDAIVYIIHISLLKNR